MSAILKRIDKTAGTLSSVGSFFAGIILLAMVIVVVLEVIARKTMNTSFTWSIEVVEILMVWFCFLTLAVIQKKGRHVYVDFLVGKLAPKSRAIWNIVPLSLAFAFIILIIIYTGDKFITTFQTGETSSSIWNPLVWPLKLAYPLGGILLAFQILSDLVNGFQNIRDRAWDSEDATENHKENKSYLSLPVFLILFVLSSFAAGWLFIVNPIPGLACALIVLLLSGVHIYAALGWIGIAGMYLHFGGSLALTQVPGIIEANLANYTLAALPPFILSGFIIQQSGAGEELYSFFNKWVGRLPGGLGISTTLACSFFAAISISSISTVATLGLIAIPALIKRKYEKSFAYGLVGSGATLGIMIPPSGTMILYAMMTEESLGQLLVAGLLPGLMLASFFIVYTIFYAYKTGSYEKEATVSWSERFQTTKTALWTILVPVIIIAGIFSGVFTVLECGAVAALYTIIMALARRKFTMKEIPSVLSECGINAGFIMIIIVGAMIMGRFITLLQVSNLAMDAVTHAALSPGMVIFVILCFLTVLGLFLDVASVMLITLPVVYPLVISLGFNGVWFAVLMTVALELAIITPPVGMNLYVIQGFTKDKLSTIVQGMIPFFCIMVLGMIAIFFFPQISLFLPRFAGF